MCVVFRWTLIISLLVLTSCDGNRRGGLQPSVTAKSKNDAPSKNDLIPTQNLEAADPTQPTASIAGGLSARIELEAPDQQLVIEYDKPIRIVLVNHSDQIIRVWPPDTKNGYYQVSFRFENLQSGAVYSAHRRAIDDEKFWKAHSPRNEHESEKIEIARGGELAIEVTLSEFAWGKRAWLELPSPNAINPYLVSVQFEITPSANRMDEKVWTGKISSIPVKARFLANRLKTPHNYLWYGFADKAIEMMEADLKWVGTRDEDSCTPLHHAARFGPPKAVQWLLDHGADVNAIAYNGFTPLHLSSDPAIVQLILQRKPDLTIRAVGQTLLQSATAHLADAWNEAEKEKWRQNVKLYEEAGADYDILSAIERNDLQRVTTILTKSPEFADDYQEQSPLRAAASRGHLEICQYLLANYQIDVNDFGRGAGYPIIKEAVVIPEIVRLLIRHRADLKTRITWQGYRSRRWIIGDDATVLHYAAGHGVPEAIGLLIDHGIDVFALAVTHDFTPDWERIAVPQTALDVAVAYGKGQNAIAILGHPKFAAGDAGARRELLDRCLGRGVLEADGPEGLVLVKALVEKGADLTVTRRGISVVRAAARMIHPTHEEENSRIRDTVAYLVEHGAKLDLFSVVALGDIKQVQQMLARDPQQANARDFGYPALHFAVGMDYRNIIVALLEAGGDVDIRSKSESTGQEGETALHAAAFWGRYEIAQTLIGAGADVNALTDRNSTPLHDAARLGNETLVKLLLENGAKRDARDKDSKTPWDWCRESNPSNAAEIEKLLLRYLTEKET